jgi:hypothetical protein
MCCLRQNSILTLLVVSCFAQSNIVVIFQFKPLQLSLQVELPREILASFVICIIHGDQGVKNE